MFQGVSPLRVLILTIPLFRSPYSAEGTPVMTSMDWTFSVEMFLVPVPDIDPKEALFPTLTPSTSSAVPNAAFPAARPPERNDTTLSVVRSGFTVFPPGRRALISVTLDIWRWFNAFAPNFSDVFMPSLSRSAVTTTLLRAKVF